MLGQSRLRPSVARTVVRTAIVVIRVTHVSGPDRGNLVDVRRFELPTPCLRRG
jgi:hypothetical protein